MINDQSLELNQEFTFFLEKYKFLTEFDGFTATVHALAAFKINCRMLCGITGSSISMKIKDKMDIDFICVLSDEDFLSRELTFPTHFDSTYWDYALTIKSATSIDVIGAKCRANPNVHLEIYRYSSIIDMLSYKSFPIRRIKGPIPQTKIEKFLNIRGKIIEHSIVTNGDHSLSHSFSEEAGELYWGMHFERILLCDIILDDLYLTDKISATIHQLLNNLPKETPMSNLFINSIENKINIFEYFKSK